MTYILIVVATHGLGRHGVSVSEMRTKTACEAAVKVLKDKNLWGIKSVECVEVKP